MSSLTTLTYGTFGEVLHSPESRVTWLHEFHRVDFLRVIKQASRGLLSRDDLQDVYQESFHDFYVVLGRTALPSGEYLPTLQCIAYRRSIDALRARGYRHRTNVDQLVSLIDESAADSAWSLLVERMSPAERREFTEAVLGLLEELPPRQQLVARIYIEHLEDFGPRHTYQRLTELVSAVTERLENVETIKSLWHAARATLAAALGRRGFSG
jgi:DNA-directed RNA polymerase specialized sigma24 family protein